MNSRAATPAHPELTSRPRYCTARRLDRPTRGRIIAKVAAQQGWPFFPWQDDAIDVAMEYDPITGLPHYRTVGVSVARQNGKTTLCLARVGAQLIIPRSTVAYTAQDRGLARIKWAEHVDVLMTTPFASRVAFVERTNHREMLVMQNGSRYLPFTPNKKAIRSLSIDLAVIDEAWAHESMEVVDAVKPAMMARPRAQMWLLSMAGTIDSKLWNHYTDLGRLEVGNPASSVCWIEYSADPDADVLDRQAWIDANPSLDLPGGVTAIGLGDAALTMDADGFRRESLNIKTDVTTSTGIDKATWAGCYHATLTPGRRVGVSLDITPERDRGTLTVVGMVGDRAVIEIIESTSDLAELYQATIDVAKEHRAIVAIDSTSPGKSAVPRLEKARVKVRMVSQPDYATACGDFYDAAKAVELAHNGDYRLADAVGAATKRKVADGWVWNRRGGADITPLTSATLARWQVVTSPPRRSAYDDEDEAEVEEVAV